MLNQVFIWNNAGERTAVLCATLAEARAVAKQSRTRENQTVKIGDAFGALYHWSRVMASAGNKWITRIVVNDVFLSYE